MKLNELMAVSPGKMAALKQRIVRLGVDLEQVEESFVAGGGKGGQKINKTANAVVLRYSPLGLIVRVQHDRRRSVNRFLALRILVDRAESILSPATAPKRIEAARRKKQKARRWRRARSKPGWSSSEGGV